MIRNSYVAAHTCTSVSLLRPFPTTMWSRIERSLFCIYCLHSPFWRRLFTLSLNVFISLFLRNSKISAPFLFCVDSPYCSMFSLGLLAFPILKAKSPTNITSTCPLYFCASTATASAFLRICRLLYSSTLEACMCLLRKGISMPAPLVPLRICFHRILCR